MSVQDEDAVDKADVDNGEGTDGVILMCSLGHKGLQMMTGGRCLAGSVTTFS